MTRDKIIIRTGVIGIIANVFLSAFKAVIGLLSGSIAITLDAVNNLSDALSSVITIVSTKLAGRTPDKKHPYGHGRIEYIGAVIISVIILYAGITSLVESVKKIITPETPDYSAVGLVIIAVAVAVKIVLGLYVRKTGESVNSDSLVASGKDALLDAVISTSTLAAAAVFLIWGVSLEAWLGAVISLVIIKAGIDTLRESLSSILGERVEGEVSDKIRETVMSFPEVKGMYDLVLHSYGPEMRIGSLHIEVPSHFTARTLDLLERKIAEKVYADCGVIITGISVYSASDRKSLENRVFSDILKAADRDGVLQIHGFMLDEENKEIYFDVIIDYSDKKRQELFESIAAEVGSKYPDYKIKATLDADAADL